MHPRITAFSFCLLIMFVALVIPPSASAGCGCDKPPPAPAAVVPNFAFPGMAVTLFDSRLQAGQQWTVRFQSGPTIVAVIATVVVKRDITTAGVYRPQLVVTMPNVPVGPTSIMALTKNTAFTVPQQSFTTIAKPVMVAEQNIDYDMPDYSTAVGADGTLYMSIGGLDKVCHSMKFDSRADGTPLRFRQGDAVIFNHQGLLIDALTPQSLNRFTVRPEKSSKRSDRLIYLRHSFVQYCQAHQAGGPKEVDPTDPNWHKDGTLHIDYSTLVFAITGTVNGAPLTPGSIAADLSFNTQFGPETEPWEVETEEEGIH